ncbi:hypothetical protein J6590_069352 [Homalodisca vitripennis]|nr:hypothetical protein J6590_069352 [Homalodisca vitripennis]
MYKDLRNSVLRFLLVKGRALNFKIKFPSVRLSVCPSVRLSVYPSVRLSVYPSVRLSVYPSVRLSVYPSVRLSVCPSIRLSVYPSIGLSVYPSVRLSVYPSIRLSGRSLLSYVLQSLLYMDRYGIDRVNCSKRRGQLSFKGVNEFSETRRED